MPLQLKGFYWDEDKKKYFKILPKQLAPPGSKYTREAISALENGARQKADRTLYEDWRSTWKSVKRADIGLGDRYLLMRAISDFKHLPPFGLVADCLTRHQVQPMAVCGLGEELYSNDGTVHTICYNAWDKSLLVSYAFINPYSGTEQTCVTSHSLSSKAPTSGRLSKTPNCTGIFQSLVHKLAAGPFQSQIFALNNGVGMLLQPEGNRYETTHYTRFMSDFAIRPHELGYPSGIVYNSAKSVFWDDLGLSEPTQVMPDKDDPAADVLSVEWIDKNVFVAGMRNGLVSIYDIRAGGSSINNRGGQKCMTERLQHSSAAIQLNTLNQSQILVVGLENEMALYDLRFTRQPPTRAASPSFPPAPVVRPRRRGSFHRQRQRLRQYRQNSGRPPSTPLVTYPGYHNSVNIRVPISVSARLGVVAVANATKGVDLFDLWHGTKLPGSLNRVVGTGNGGSDGGSDGGSLPVPRPMEQREQADVSAVFLLDTVHQVRGCSRGPSLFLGRGNNVEEWTWP